MKCSNIEVQNSLESCTLNKKIPDYMFAKKSSQPQEDSFVSNAIMDIADFLGKK